MMNFVKKHPLLTAFLIPFFICIIICIGNGVYPFGDYCLLHMDLYHQYLPFFNELWEKLRNGASLMYTWNIGLGSDFVSVFAYYLASPLNWLVVLFPKSHIIEFIELLIIFKYFVLAEQHFLLIFLVRSILYFLERITDITIIHLCRHLFFLRHMRFPAL